MNHKGHNPEWALFYDFHTMPAIPDVGHGFDAERFTDRIAACGVDYIVFPARCNLGMAYYDTKVGIRHPSLDYDLFGRLADACQRRGIALSAYVNVGLSHEEALLHRDWATLWPEGHIYKPDRLDHFFRTMCYNTPYGDHVLAMIREVASGYPIVGFMLDCMILYPCTGVECIREMKERGMDWTDPIQLREFAHFSSLRIARRISDTIRAEIPDPLIYFNGIPYEDQEQTGTYLELECLPTGGWGYEAFPLASRYMRTLGKPVLNMTGRFHKSWGDFGGIRTEASLEYDCRHALANCMRPTIGGHMHPRGDINDAVFDLIEPIYARLRKLDPWTLGATPVTDVGLVNPAKPATGVHPEEERRVAEIMQGASRLLCELNVQFDVLSFDKSWKGYRLLVLPDELALGETAAAKIRAHLDDGGAILSSGWSGLDPDRQGFLFPEWGITFHGDDPHDPAYYVAKEPLADGIPAMPNNFYCEGTAIEAGPWTEVLANIVRPYFNRHWDGEHGFLYIPPDAETDRPAVTLKGRIAHISHAVFRGYHESAPVPLRQIVANLLKRLLAEPAARADSLPSFARLTVTRQANRRMLHVLAYVPERRGPNIDMIEEPIELRDVNVSLRLDGTTPTGVYEAPSEQALPYDVADGYLTTRIPLVRGHAVVVVEHGD